MRLLLFFLFIFCLPVCDAAPKVLVSVAPQKFLVETIAKNHVEVVVLVPSGASPHSYEPSMRQMMEAFEGKIWFRIGEGFETRAQSVLSTQMDIVDQREGVHLLPCGCHHQDRDAHDSHIWLSPNALKIQAQTITKALSRHFPDLTSFFEKNCSLLCHELDALDEEIRSLVASCQCRTVLVSHPAFGYFCRDYGFVQLSIEIEGKEPTPKQVTLLLQEARKAGIHRVYVQPQYNQKGAVRVAQELHATLETIDPYQEDVIASLRKIAQLFSEVIL